MTSIACVQAAWPSTVANVAASAAKGAISASSATASIGGSSSSQFCSFLGSEIHASRSSPVFNHDRSLWARQSTLPRRTRRSQNLVVQGIFGLGVPEVAVIVGVAALVFGPKKLPEIGKSLGKTVKSFQQAAKEFEKEVKGSSAVVEPTATETSKIEPGQSSGSRSSDESV